MTDQEINESVARKLGWEVPGYGTERSIKELFKCVPDYCHSIEAAWEIISKNEGLILHKYPFRRPHWRSCVIRENDEADAEAATAPMAICLAFLKLA
jgi:hypothetical protein